MPMAAFGIGAVSSRSLVEGSGVGRSIARSSALTKGARLEILVITVLFSIIVHGTTFLVSNVGTWAFSRVHAARAEAERDSWLLHFAVRGVMDTLGAVAPVVGYYALRSGREQVDIEEIAAVFD
jgi:hypothetical protein